MTYADFSAFVVEHIYDFLTNGGELGNAEALQALRTIAPADLIQGLEDADRPFPEGTTEEEKIEAAIVLLSELEDEEHQ